MTRRTVLQVIPDLQTGGAERTTVDVARALVAAGHRAIVVSRGGRLVAELEAVGGEHVTMPAGRKSPLGIWRNAGALTRLAREEGVDLIHARSRAPAWSALIAARRLGLPFVTTYHGIYNQTNALKGLYNSVMARGDAVIANSRYTAALIAERHPFAKDRITVIHRGSDLAALDPASVSPERRQALADAWGLRDGERVILNLARLTHWKGQTVLIDALARLAAAPGAPSGWTAILAGDAQGRETYVAELKTRIANAGLSNRVRLVGHCADVAAALALADVAVVASIEPEAFGRAAVEAQAAGVPVVATNLGAVPETVLAPPDVAEEARTGWRVPANDAHALALALAEMLALAPQDREALAARALAHVRQDFTVEAMCEATLAVYDSLAQAR
ncbi:glycosyltransferase family 4 protein [Stappia indica]|uniref:Glycosyltransferase involved in cell wall bisynthesis n=1 Tax=Stappia indica TaxID=538381 RepID=A0A285TG07_9HYPH|nr:glycosyltransferase family 4 protein [Stappia indica]SOC19372.1 Glycosyltransferase involved in cell wall bisynthesis [Stappia indica]